METVLLAILIIATIVALTLTIGRRSARRAERHIGAWAWITYVGLGAGMMFGAMSMEHALLSTFMWTKLTAFIFTGLYLVRGRMQRGERLLPMRRALAAE